MNDIILAGDLNQDIVSREVQQFFNKLGIKDIHQQYNFIELDEIDNTYRDRSKYIDTIAASESILSFVEGCRLYEINEILDTNHRGYIIDIDLKEYFDQEFSSWNQINKSLLDPEKGSHREKFKELVEKMLDSIDIEGNLSKLIEENSSK